MPCCVSFASIRIRGERLNNVIHQLALQIHVDAGWRVCIETCSALCAGLGALPDHSLLCSAPLLDAVSDGLLNRLDGRGSAAPPAGELTPRHRNNVQAMSGQLDVRGPVEHLVDGVTVVQGDQNVYERRTTHRRASMRSRSLRASSGTCVSRKGCAPVFVVDRIRYQLPLVEACAFVSRRPNAKLTGRAPAPAFACDGAFVGHGPVQRMLGRPASRPASPVASPETWPDGKLDIGSADRPG
jgi:hypothetical protein